MPDLNIPDPDPRDLDGTQPGKPVRIPAPIPQERPALPPRPPRQAERSRRRRDKRKNDQQPTPQRNPRRSGLYLPAWSLGLMLLLVIGISFAIVLLVYAVGGRAIPGGDPVVVIITAYPSSTPPLPQFEPTLPDATLPGINADVPQFPLEGPTLPPVILSPTPATVVIGSSVRTTGESVRVRPQPSLDNQELFFAEPEEVFLVIEGPSQGSGLTWWRVQDASDPGRSGWIAANLIEVVSP